MSKNGVIASMVDSDGIRLRFICVGLTSKQEGRPFHNIKVEP